MGEGLDVVDEGRPAVHTALRGERRLHRGPGVAPGQEPGEGRLLARDVPVRDLGDTHIDRIGPGALREGGRDPGDLQPTFAKAQHRVPRTLPRWRPARSRRSRDAGRRSSNTRSLTLAGSPSQPFATTMGRPRAAATAASLRAVGNPPPPRPRRPARATVSASSARPARCRESATGNGPYRAACAARSAGAPVANQPASSRGRARPSRRRSGAVVVIAARPHAPGLGVLVTGPHPDDDRGRDRQRAPGVDGPHPTEGGVRAAYVQPVHERRPARAHRRSKCSTRQSRHGSRMRTTLVTTRASSRSAAAAPNPVQKGW